MKIFQMQEGTLSPQQLQAIRGGNGILVTNDPSDVNPPNDGDLDTSDVNPPNFGDDDPTDVNPPSGG